MIEVGDTIYRFDWSRRVYSGKGIGARIIYAEHFEPFAIVGETKFSWLVNTGWQETKVNKATLKEASKNGFGYQWFTADGMAANIWRNENFYELMRHVEHNASTDQLKQIAELVGFTPKNKR